MCSLSDEERLSSKSHFTCGENINKYLYFWSYGVPTLIFLYINVLTNMSEQ